MALQVSNVPAFTHLLRKIEDTMKSSLSLKDFQLYFPFFLFKSTLFFFSEYFFLVGLKEAKVENVLRLIKNIYIFFCLEGFSKFEK